MLLSGHCFQIRYVKVSDQKLSILWKITPYLRCIPTLVAFICFVNTFMKAVQIIALYNAVSRLIQIHFPPIPLYNGERKHYSSLS